QVREDRRPVVPLGQIRSSRLTQVVVRRRKADAGQVAVVLDRQLPEGGEEVDLHSRVFQGGGEGCVPQQGVHGLQGGGTVDAPSAVGENAPLLQGQVAVLQGDQVAAEGGVPRGEDDAGGCGLHGGAAGEV